MNDYEKSYQEIVDESGQPMLYLTGHPNNQGKKLDFIVSKLGNKDEQARRIDSPVSKSPMLHLGARTNFPKKKRTPTVCKICKKAFNYKSNMIRHMRAIHKTNEIKSNQASPTSDLNFSNLTKYENSMVNLDRVSLDRGLISPNTLDDENLNSFNENIDSICANSDNENDKNEIDNEINNSEFDNDMETDLSETVNSDFNDTPKNKHTADNSSLSKSPRKRKSLSSCKICQKQFNYKSNMYRHLRVVHNNQKTLHSCSMCPKTFTETSNLRRHMLNTHKL